MHILLLQQQKESKKEWRKGIRKTSRSESVILRHFPLNSQSWKSAEIGWKEPRWFKRFSAKNNIDSSTRCTETFLLNEWAFCIKATQIAHPSNWLYSNKVYPKYANVNCIYIYVCGVDGTSCAFNPFASWLKINWINSNKINKSISKLCAHARTAPSISLSICGSVAIIINAVVVVVLFFFNCFNNIFLYMQ